jgi:hypothetical protein
MNDIASKNDHVHYYDFSNRESNPAHYENSDHLNFDGAKHFTQLIKTILH